MSARMADAANPRCPAPRPAKNHAAAAPIKNCQILKGIMKKLVFGERVVIAKAASIVARMHSTSSPLR